MRVNWLLVVPLLLELAYSPLHSPCTCQVIRTAKLMTAVGKHLQIPTLATEQYPKAFGATVSG
jgi:hypothetical protein